MVNKQGQYFKAIKLNKDSHKIMCLVTVTMQPISDRRGIVIEARIAPQYDKDNIDSTLKKMAVNKEIGIVRNFTSLANLKDV